jgi:cytochrome c biogenesis protein CcmG/thiol:disulfide interchange protein DsbE
MRRFVPLLTFLFFAGALALVLLLPQNPKKASDMKGATFPAITLEVFGTAPESALVQRPRIVNFFASWCTPCIAELPHLRALANATGAQLVGIAWSDREQALAAWLDKYNQPFDVVYRDDNGAFGIALGLRGVPETYLLAADGRILRHHIGVITPAQLPALEASFDEAR